MSATTQRSQEPLDTLHILGIGLFTEMFQQSQIWDLLHRKDNGSILPTGQHFYLQDSGLRKALARKRCANALAYAIQDFTQNWPIPSVSIWPDKKASADAVENSDTYFSGFIDGLRMDAGMESHQIASLGAFCRDEPEEVIERAFQFMEGYPDVPALLLLATDGDMARAITGDSSREAFRVDGPRRFGSMCETAVALLLARPDRLSRLHPFAVNQDVVDARGGEHPPGFKPSKYIPAPWSIEQLKQFYAMQPVAQIHRPTRITYKIDSEGKPTFDKENGTSIMTQKQKEAAVKAALASALKSTEQITPRRVFYDTGGTEKGGNLVPLALAADENLPGIDLFNPKQGFDLGTRLGNTGAASSLVQVALAAYATAANNDASITAQLRQDDEASIMIVTPAKPLRSASATKPATASAAQQPTAAPRHIILGTRIASGNECPQSGMWKCDRANVEGGATHFIPAGRTLPRVVVVNEVTSWQKLRGESGREQVSAIWTLVSYDVATH